MVISFDPSAYLPSPSQPLPLIHAHAKAAQLRRGCGLFGLAAWGRRGGCENDEKMMGVAMG